MHLVRKCASLEVRSILSYRHPTYGCRNFTFLVVPNLHFLKTTELWTRSCSSACFRPLATRTKVAQLVHSYDFGKQRPNRRRSTMQERSLGFWCFVFLLRQTSSSMTIYHWYSSSGVRLCTCQSISEAVKSEESGKPDSGKVVNGVRCAGSTGSISLIAP